MNNQRGTAVLEGIGVIFVITAFVGVVMMGAYLWFARGWIQYQSEQALYCLAESRLEYICRRQLTKNVKRFLPLGDFKEPMLFNTQGNYRIKMEWRWEWKWDREIFGYGVHIDKKLNLKQIPRQHLVTKGSR